MRLMAAISLDIARVCAGLSGGTIAIDPAVQVLECRGAQCHDNCTQNKESHAAFKWHLFEDRVRIPAGSA